MSKYSVKQVVLENEFWWGGAVEDSIHMPITQSSVYEIDLRWNKTYNQAAPIFVSSKGRYFWSKKGFKIQFELGNIYAESDTEEIVFSEGHDTLRGAFLDLSNKYFFKEHTIPQEIMFRVPQYCTWIELLYNQNQKDIIKYAQSILDSGLPAGEIIIDDCWQEYYGKWNFKSNTFPNPKEMVDQLHEMGFKVVLWICPFITADTIIFRELKEKNLLVKGADGNPAIKEWWNGYSSVLDMSNPEAISWFEQQTDYLINEYGVDGFKQDAGDAMYYDFSDETCLECEPNMQSEIWAKLALKYSFNELRAGFNNSGKPIVQRLCDKNHSWTSENGLAALIPSALVQGILGYYYTCPDMIGGGQYLDFVDHSNIDFELFIRYCQCSTLMPMMQFSYSIWKRQELNAGDLCVKCAWLHQEFSDYIIKNAKIAAKTGEPIVRYMDYQYPNQGFGGVKDQFMLGDDYLVAPVYVKGMVTREVYLPKGTWCYVPTNHEYKGGQVVVVDAPLEVLPYFKKIS